MMMIILSFIKYILEFTFSASFHKFQSFTWLEDGENCIWSCLLICEIYRKMYALAAVDMYLSAMQYKDE